MLHEQCWITRVGKKAWRHLMQCWSARVTTQKNMSRHSQVWLTSRGRCCTPMTTGSPQGSLASASSSLALETLGVIWRWSWVDRDRWVRFHHKHHKCSIKIVTASSPCQTWPIRSHETLQPSWLIPVSWFSIDMIPAVDCFELFSPNSLWSQV